MPAANSDLFPPQNIPEVSTAPASLPFPPLTQQHIINCSVASWWPRYRTLTPKTRIIPLPPSFIAYLRADSIIIPPNPTPALSSSNPRIQENIDPSKWEDSEEGEDPSKHWSETHIAVQETIKALDGSVYPKLDWSAPKDATWMSPTNSMECTTANEVYTLLKSSDFVSHDLEEVWKDCVDATYGPRQRESDGSDYAYNLILRKTVRNLIPSMEFRCWVRGRRLVAICQRDLNHYDFLPELLPVLRDLIEDFFEEKLRDTFPDPNFVFDVYIPRPKELSRVWLMDINPWAVRTDSLLFSWMELLNLERSDDTQETNVSIEEGVVRLRIAEANEQIGGANQEDVEDDKDEFPVFRIVKKDDPEAYSFNAPQYGAHKLPKDVVDASMQGQGGMAEFATRWKDLMEDAERRRREGLDEETDDDSSDADD